MGKSLPGITSKLFGSMPSGDKMAAANLAEAAAIMLQSPGAIQLRTLQTVDGLGPTPSNTVILFPAELGDALRGFVDSVTKK